MRVAFAAVSLGLLSLSCATPKVKLDEGPREYVATDYDTVLKAWTRDKQFTNVNVMDNVLSVTATYESWDFRWAYVVRYAEDYRLTVDQRRALKHISRCCERIVRRVLGVSMMSNLWWCC